VVDYQQGANARAYQYLKPLEVSAPEADAERLCYLVECARRLDRDDEVIAFTQRLGELYPGSEWRKRALISAANRMTTLNRADVATSLYHACADSFPRDPEAPLCHWKVTWQAVIQRRAEAGDLLREHLQRYPASPRIPPSSISWAGWPKKATMPPPPGPSTAESRTATAATTTACSVHRSSASR